MDKAYVTRLLATTASIAWLVVNAPVHAQSPQAPTVAAGSIAITRQGATTVVNQATDRGIIDWRSFSIGAGEAVRFDQPGRSSVTLNRVTGSELSRIDGNLSANGQVWLANPNGVLIGNSGQVNVGGLLATTGRVDAVEFLKSGRAAIDQIGKDVSIANFGTVNIAEGGYAALAAASIRNEGVVAARKGSVALGAGKAVTVDFTGDKLITFQVTKSLDQAASGDSMISVGGKIAAEGGTVLMSARAAKGVMDNVINLRGHVVANSVTVDGGTVSFGDGGIVQVSGKIDASNLAGKGGEVAILGEKVGLMDGASVDASGALGGGTVLVGGDWQGKGPAHNATIAYVAPTASINVDATMAGDGGKVVVWADDSARFDGTISARGGLLAGNGGQVETSGKRALNVGDAAAVTTAARAGSGKPGAWLLDPNDITINASNNNITGSSPFQALGPGSSNVTPAAINAALDLGDVTIQTSAGSGGNGDISFVIGKISTTVATPRTLTLLADRDIVINNATIALTGAAHNIVLRASANAATQAAVTGGIKIQSGTVTTTGGAITLSAGLGGALAASGSSVLGGRGIYILDNSIINAGAGTFLGRGLGRAGFDGPFVQGFELSNSSTLTANGGVTMIGTGGDSSTDQSRGVQLFNGAVVNVNSGTLSIQGEGGAATGTISRGVQIEGATINAGGAKVNIVGKAAASNTKDTNYGVYFAVSSLTGSGDVSITGTGGGKLGSGANHGIYVESTSIALTGAATLTLDGARGGADGANVRFDIPSISTKSGAISITALSTATIGDGVRIAGGGGSISTVDGAITITARAGNGGGTAFNSDGKSPVQATGAGTVTIEAAAAAGAGFTAPNGVSGFIALAKTNTGDLTVRTNSLAWGGSVFGGALASTIGTVKLQPIDATKSIGVGAVSGLDLSVSEFLISTINGKVEIGRADLSAAIQVGSNFLAPKNLTLRTGSGAINFQGGVGALTAGAQSLTAVTTSGAVTFNGTVGGTIFSFPRAFSTIDVQGPAKFNGGWPIISTGSQSYSGAVVYGATGGFTTTNSNIFFGSTADGVGGLGDLTFTLGTGTANFAGAVGATTSAFGNLSFGNAAFAGDVITTNGQSYNGVVTLTGKNTTLSAQNSAVTFASGSSISYVNAAAGSLSILSAGDIQFVNGSIKSTSAALNLTLNSGANATTQATVFGGIRLTNTTISTLGGNIALVGGKGGTLAASGTAAINGWGVLAEAASVIDAGAGTFIGRGAGGVGVLGSFTQGFELNNAKLTANGGVTIVGTGGNAGLLEWRGVNLIDSTINVAGGDVSITGTGGTKAGAGSNQAAAGVFITNTGLTLGSGAVSITGAAGGAATSNQNTGVHIQGTSALTGSGAMTITGIGGGAGGSTVNHGVSVETASVAVSGAGTLTIDGTRGVGGGSHNIALDSKAAISSASGAINLIGSASTGGAPASLADGLNMLGGVTTADGAITLHGVAALSSGSSFGVRVAGTIQATGSGTILIRGGPGLSGDGYGQTKGLVSTKSGDLTLQASSPSIGGAAALTTSSGTIRLQPYASSESMLVIGGLFSALSGPVVVGKADMTGAISVLAATLNNNASFVTKSGAISFQGALEAKAAGQTLKIDSGTALTSFAGSVGANTAFASIDVTGSASFGSVTVKTSGTQSYAGAVILANAGTTSFSTTNAAFTFGSTVDGPGSLSVSTGTGTYNAVGPIGATTALGSIILNGALNLGATVFTTGAQSYTGSVSLTAANTLLETASGDISILTGGKLTYALPTAGSLTLKAAGDIIMNGGQIISTGSKLDVTLNAGALGATQLDVAGGVTMNGATITTNGGSLSIVGGAGGAFAAMGSAAIGGRGIYVIGASKFDLGAGSFTAKGIGRNGVASTFVEGVVLFGGTTVTANGGLTLEGTSGDGATTEGRGVRINAATIGVSGGNVSITGKGGGSAVVSRGVDLLASKLDFGSGAVTITGFGGTNNFSLQNNGVFIDGTTAMTSSGAVTINGTGGGNGGAFTTENNGVLMSGGSIAVSGAGTLAIIGQRNVGADSVNVQLKSGTLSTDSGALTLTGTYSGGGADKAGPLNSVGVLVDSGATVKTVSGLISLNGTGAAADGKGADGLRIAGTVQATGAGGISLTGVRGGATAASPTGNNDNIEIKAGGLVSTGFGAITMTASDSSGAGPSDVGFRNAGTVTSTSGNLSITGVGAALGTIAHGVDNLGSISTAGAGTITIAGAPGASGVAFNTGAGSKITTAGGQLTLKGSGYAGPGQLAATGGVIARQAFTPSQSLTIAIGAGSAELDLITAASVVIGEAAMTGDITVSAGSLAKLKTNTTFITQSGAINVTGAIDANTAGGQSLKFQSATGLTSLAGSVGATTAFASIDVSGPISFAPVTVKTTGTQSYAGAVTLPTVGTTSFSTTNAAFSFGSTVDGPGSLSVSTGTGTYNAVGPIGATTALASITLNGLLNLGATVFTTGAQSYTGPVSLTTANTLLETASGDISILTGGVLTYALPTAGSLTLKAARDILIDGGKITSTGGKLDVTLNAGALDTTQATVQGGVLINGGTITTAGGSLSIVGGQNGTLAAMGSVDFPDFGLSVRDGVLLAASTINVGAGAILVRGTARDSGFFFGHGVEVNNTTLTGLGGVTMIGQGSGTATAEANGINLVAGAKLDGGAGGVVLTGTGGAGAGLVSGVVVNNSIVQASGKGAVTVTGVKGTGSGAGLSMSAGSLTTAGGALTVKAAEQAVSGASTIDAGAGTVSLQSPSVTTALTVSAGILSYVNAAALTIGETGQAAAINIAAGAIVKQNLTVLSGAGPVNFLGAIDASTAGGQSLKIQSATGSTSFAGSVGATTAFASIDVTGSMTASAAEIKTTGTQSYAGPAQIASGATTIFATNNAAVSFGGALNGPGGLGFKVGTATVSLTGGVGTSVALGSLSVDKAALGGTIVTTGAQSYGAVTLLSATTLSTSVAAPISFGGAVSGANALTIDNAGGAVAFTAGAGPLASLTQLGGGVVTLGGGIATTLGQTYSGDVNLTTGVTLSSTSGAINFANAVNSATTPVALTLDAAVGVGFSAGAGAATALASLTLLGGGKSTLGGAFKTTGEQSYAGAVSLADDSIFSTAGAGLIFNGAVGSGAGKSMTVLAGTGGVTFAAGAGLSGGPLGGVNIDAPLSVNGGVTTTGAQSYGGAITLTGKSAFNAPGQTIAFKGNVSGAYGLSVNAASIQLGGAGPITVQTTGTGDQFYLGAIVLANDATLEAAGSMSLNDTVNGAKNLAVKGSVVNLNAKIGGSAPLASFTAATTGGLIAINADILTSGAQSYANNVALTNDVTLSSAASNVTFAASINSSGGPKSLSVTVADPAGVISFGGSVGGVGAMNSVVLSANGANVALPSINAANFTAITKGTVSQVVASSLTISGNAFIDANAGINLSNSGNDFGQIALTTGGAATMADVNGFVLSNSTVVGDLTLDAAGPVTQSGPLSAGGLLLQGSGVNYNLDNNNNAVSNLAAKVAGGSIAVVNGPTTSLAIGSAAGVTGVTGAGNLAIGQLGISNTLGIVAPIDLGTGSATLASEGLIKGTGSITGATPAALSLSAVAPGSEVLVVPSVKVSIAGGAISVNGVLFNASGAVPVVTATVATIPTVPSVASLDSQPATPTVATVASQASQPTGVTQASPPIVVAVPEVEKPVEAVTTPRLIGSDPIESVVGRLIVSIDLAVPSASRTLATTTQEEDSGSATLVQVQQNSQTSGSSSRGGEDSKATEVSAQRQLSLVNATPVGALIPPSPSAVSSTGAPLASSSTIKLDPADTGGANGQVIARGGADSAVSGVIGASSQAGGTTTIVPGLVVQAPRPSPPRAEPPLAEQPSTINEEVFLD